MFGWRVALLGALPPSLSMGKRWAAPAGAELSSQDLHTPGEQSVPWPAAAAGVFLLVSQEKGAGGLWRGDLVSCPGSCKHDEGGCCHKGLCLYIHSCFSAQENRVQTRFPGTLKLNDFHWSKPCHTAFPSSSRKLAGFVKQGSGLGRGQGVGGHSS